MWGYIVILAAIWIGLLIPVVRERRAWIACAHGGTGLFFTALLLGLGIEKTGDLTHVVWLEVAGLMLLVPAIILIAAAMIAVAKGRLVTSGIMRIVRHPMYLGTAVASLGLILLFQSVLVAALSVISIALLWAASKAEDDYNIMRFGDSYRKYMESVPRWNVIKGLRRR